MLGISVFLALNDALKGLAGDNSHPLFECTGHCREVIDGGAGPERIKEHQPVSA